MDPASERVALIAVSLALAVLIWLVQLIIYPSFHHLDRERFVAWHLRYTGLITWIVLPLMLGQVGLLGLLLATDPAPAAALWAQAPLVALAWLATFIFSVPAHGRLQQGKDDRQIAWLVSTNWIRTAAWTMCVPLSWLARP